MFILQRLEDPRDALDKAGRSQLVKFARRHGVEEIGKNPSMPAMLMRRILRQRGLTEIGPSRHELPTAAGSANSQPQAHGDFPVANVPTTDAVEEMARQWQAEKDLGVVDKMNIRQLRTEAKRRGVKLTTHDTVATMKAKIRGQDAS